MGGEVEILCVDDDPGIRRALSRYLSSVGYQVDTVGSGEEMRQYLKNKQPDLILLDLELPDSNGLELAKELRKETGAGIIILTGSEEQIDKIIGLEVGADDFMQKPFDERELLARIHSVLRRTGQIAKTQSNDNTIARFGNWTVDLTAHTVSDQYAEEVVLTSHEFQLLTILIHNANKVLSRDQIMDKMSGRDWIPSDRSIDVLVSKLRKKIESDHTQPSLIKTIRGSGYILTSKVEFSQ